MKDIKIAVIGLGYVGLPLARLFSTKYETVGFDMNQKRVDALMTGHDATLEVADDLLQDAIKITVLSVPRIWKRFATATSMWWLFLLLLMRTRLLT